MQSASGRFVIVFNGEIYNYRDLRRDLEGGGVLFRGHSDTEVLLEAVERWGLDEALRRSYGMFALGLWDRQQRVLHLVRDRVGEKPLYYGVFGDTLLFGSELKALRAHPAFRADIDRDALTLLLRHDYIPAPHSIYQQVRKLEPGTILRVRAAGRRIEQGSSTYWSLGEVVRQGLADSLAGSPQEIVEQVGGAIRTAVERQLVADVPVGAFLSGGVDSSLIVATMQSLASRPVRTFSIGFWEREFDEAPHARRIARHLGADHTELTVTAADALTVIPNLPAMYDEPFADSSQIPTYLVSRLARASVTVSLSGDAGDELFAGYSRYGGVLDRWRRLERWPRLLRTLASLGAVPLIPGLTPALGILPSQRGRADLPDRLRRRVSRWQAGHPLDLYRENVSYWLEPARLVQGATEPRSVLSDPGEWPRGADPLQLMMYADTRMYLPDDILVKVDRAAMAVSLETRVPLLDPELIALAWRIPPRIHRLDGSGKWVTRELLARHVPRELFERPKMGFAIPLAQWLRSELYEWAAALLEPGRLAREGFFEVESVDRIWQEHQAGRADWSFQLWGLLMFQAWLEYAHPRSGA